MGLDHKDWGSSLYDFKGLAGHRKKKQALGLIVRVREGHSCFQVLYRKGLESESVRQESVYSTPHARGQVPGRRGQLPTSKAKHWKTGICVREEG